MTKIEYPKPLNYIQRHVKSINAQFDFDFRKKTLCDVIEHEKRVTILGVAGLGKSVELDFLAHLYSESNEKLFPILVRLNNVTNQSIEEIVKIDYPTFEDLSKENVLILLDALDEVHVDFVEIVTNNISLFSKKYTEIIIVVSCRNNFYSTEIEKGTAKLDSFKTFFLTPLDRDSIETFIRSNVYIGVDELFDQLERKNLFDLLSSPFYLVKILDFYNQKKELPNSRREIFEYLINERFKKDIDKFQNKRVRLEEKEDGINYTLEKIAIVMQYMGQNHLETNQIFGKIITDEDLGEVVKHTFLFNKTNRDKSWEFEHNNFKEYLAARYLSKLSVSQIKKTVSIRGRVNKIMPNWLNTLSMVFSHLSDDKKINSLINWIMRIEPDALVRFERDKLNLEIRENLFYKFHSDYSKKGILIRSEKFQFEDLAIMVSDSVQVIEYLINKIELDDDRILLINTLGLFKHFDSVNEYEVQILNVCRNKILSSEISNEIKYNIFNELTELNIYSEALTEEVIEKLKLDEQEQYLRTGFYSYLENANHSELESHLDVLLNGIKLLRLPRLLTGQRKDNSDPYLSEESYILERLFTKLDSVDSAKNTLNWILNREPKNEDDTFFKIIENTINRCRNFEPDKKNEVNPIIADLLLKFSAIYNDELNIVFKDYFTSLNTPSETINLIYSRPINEYGSVYTYANAISKICNESLIETFLGLISEGRLSDEEIFALRNVLRHQCDSYNIFYDAIIAIDSKYAYPPQLDYNELERLRFKKDRELIFSKTSFISEVQNIFDQESSEEIAVNALYDDQKDYFSHEKMANNIVVEFLRRFDRDINSVSRSSSIDFLENDTNWYFFQLRTILEWIHTKEDFDLNNVEEDFLKNWVFENIEHCDFRTAITKTRDSYNTKSLEFELSYVSRRLNLNLPEEKILDMLHMDHIHLVSKVKNTDDEHENQLVEWIISKLSESKVTERVLENIANRSIVPIVLKKHYEYCALREVETINSFILNDIKGNAFNKYEKKDLVEYFLSCKGLLSDLISLTPSLEDEVNFCILNKMIESKHPKTIECCKELISMEKNTGSQLTYINKLISVHEEVGFKFQMKWILENQCFPERWYKYKSLAKNNLSDLLFLYQSALIKGFGNERWVGHGRNECFSGILEIASSDYNSFKLAKKYLNSWLEIVPNEKVIYYQLQKLDQGYSLKQAQTLNFEQAIERINTKPNYRIVLFYERYKVIIDFCALILGLVFSILGLILAL